MTQRGISLDAPDSVIDGFTPLWGLLQAPQLLYRRRVTRTYVARCSMRPCAFLQVRDSARPAKWDVVFLGATEGARAGGMADRSELWTALLDFATAAAGRRGVPRLYAKLPLTADDAAERAMREAGYVSYGAETIYEFRGGTRVAERNGDGDGVALIRPQTTEDTWAVHQLYTWTEPKPAQYAEAYTSQRWDLPRATFTRRQPNVYGVVIDRMSDIVGYCRVTRRGKRSRIDVLVQPESRELLGRAIDAALRWLRPTPDQRVYCALRAHQQELSSVLAERGFHERGTHALLVRYTVVSVRAANARHQPAHERVRTAVPAHP